MDLTKPRTGSYGDRPSSDGDADLLARRLIHMIKNVLKDATWTPDPSNNDAYVRRKLRERKEAQLWICSRSENVWSLHWVCSLLHRRGLHLAPATVRRELAERLDESALDIPAERL